MVRSMKRDFTYQAELDDEDTHYLAEITRTEMFSELHGAISKLPKKDRKTVGSGKRGSVRVDIGGRCLFKTKNQKNRRHETNVTTVNHLKITRCAQSKQPI